MQTTSFKHIAELAETLVQNNISKVVVSPGSRNAPLIIAFDSHPSIETFVIHDERSAAFFGLGLADELGEGVAIVCTSGSAPLNYAPAIAEAYYRQIPLLVLTADRPERLIDQGDGQCIRQFDVFSNYIKTFFQIGEQTSSFQMELALKELMSSPKGPVHVNIPLEEPLYGVSDYTNVNDLTVELKEPNKLLEADKELVNEVWKTTEKKLLIIGQMIPNQRLQIVLDTLVNDSSIAVLVENTSNIKKFTKFCHSIDRTLALISEDEIENFNPELLISIGGAIISKKIKNFLRKSKPIHNWRVGEFTLDEDTYQSKTKSIKVKPELFFGFINSIHYVAESNYGNKWKAKDFISQDKHDEFIETCPFSDLLAFDFILDTLPEGINLQMANSSVIRYCQLFNPVQSISYFGNRGVSGIDGSTSTALGMAVANPNKLNVLITGDVSFFYDSNALWNSYLPSNFRIILINNNGGGIFNIIDGPKTSKQNQLFVAPHQAKAEHICKAHNVEYSYVESITELEDKIVAFYQESDGVKLIEINTSEVDNSLVLQSYFNNLNKEIK
jgi:2-succinyl-5-enolpyruvyl-6-hydroxy-3-cyclohexene-1-carboxylate synthase